MYFLGENGDDEGASYQASLEEILARESQPTPTPQVDIDEPDDVGPRGGSAVFQGVRRKPPKGWTPEQYVAYRPTQQQITQRAPSRSYATPRDRLFAAQQASQRRITVAPQAVQRSVASKVQVAVTKDQQARQALQSKIAELREKESLFARQVAARRKKEEALKLEQHAQDTAQADFQRKSSAYISYRTTRPKSPIRSWLEKKNIPVPAAFFPTVSPGEAEVSIPLQSVDEADVVDAINARKDAQVRLRDTTFARKDLEKFQATGEIGPWAKEVFAQDALRSSGQKFAQAVRVKFGL